MKIIKPIYSIVAISIVCLIVSPTILAAEQPTSFGAKAVKKSKHQKEIFRFMKERNISGDELVVKKVRGANICVIAKGKWLCADGPLVCPSAVTLTTTSGTVTVDTENCVDLGGDECDCDLK